MVSSSWCKLNASLGQVLEREGECGSIALRGSPCWWSRSLHSSWSVVFTFTA